MNIYQVEFGSKKSSGFSFLYCDPGSSLPTIYVVAETYNQAIKKALSWATEKSKTQACLDEDGNLELPQEAQIASIGVFTQNVVQ